MKALKTILAVQVIVWLVYGLLATVSYAVGRNTVTCEQAQIGMSKARVQELLGAPGSTRTESGKRVGAGDIKKVTYDLWSYQQAADKGSLTCDLYFLDDRIANLATSTSPSRSDRARK
jgi:hypothetical protein